MPCHEIFFAISCYESNPSGSLSSGFRQLCKKIRIREDIRAFSKWLKTIVCLCLYRSPINFLLLFIPINCKERPANTQFILQTLRCISQLDSMLL